MGIFGRSLSEGNFFYRDLIEIGFLLHAERINKSVYEMFTKDSQTCNRNYNLDKIVNLNHLFFKNHRMIETNSQAG